MKLSQRKYGDHPLYEVHLNNDKFEIVSIATGNSYLHLKFDSKEAALKYLNETEELTDRDREQLLRGSVQESLADAGQKFPGEEKVFKVGDEK